MAVERIRVSPGVYTSETDLTFVTRQVGVTTLGLVGETPRGPAFQPVFISNYDEFRSFFGGLNHEKFRANNYPKYELNYIARSYLSQSNQLFVTRILGLSGYNAGDAWAITIDAQLDPDTVELTASNIFNPGVLAEFTVTTANTVSVVFNDPLVAQIDAEGLYAALQPSAFIPTGSTSNSSIQYLKQVGGDIFTGASYSMSVVSTGSSVNNSITGVTTGVTVYYSGSSYSDVEDTVLALLRSRGTYNSSEVMNFAVSGMNNLGFDPTVIDTERDPFARFDLTGTTSSGQSFRYELSFNRSNRNYISKVLGQQCPDNEAPIFVEDIYQNTLQSLFDAGKVRGINLDLVYYNNFTNYLTSFKPSVTPYVLSELRGNKLVRLFRVWSISDGDAANKQIKISIQNIKLDDKEFDVVVRAFDDLDESPIIIEKFNRCSLDSNSANFISRKIGSMDGEFTLKSKYIMIEMSDGCLDDAIPAGFEGYTTRDYDVSAQSPIIQYKTSYTQFEKKRKVYLGISDTVGIDQNFFNFKGYPTTSNPNVWTGVTHGFHMDIDATGATIDGITIVVNATGGTISPVFEFDTGCCQFRSEDDVQGTDYEKLSARKFTLVPFGGFDGWDIYRLQRTNTDKYKVTGTGGVNGINSGVFTSRTTSTEEIGISSDFYAYFEGIRSMSNPESVNINIFASPGIDTFNHGELIEEAIDMIETERCDSLYIVSTPDIDSEGATFSVDDVVSNMDDLFDSNFTATYWPWLQIEDNENDVLIWLPPTGEVVRSIAFTDNVSFPWFSVAGVNRAVTNAVKARVKLTLSQRDELYDNRINPMASFPEEGVVVWGNKTLQEKDTALNRINVRRLLLQTRKLVSAVSVRLLFEQNDEIVRNQFLSLVNPILDNIRRERGLIDFRVQLDESVESLDSNEMCGRIFIKPTKALEIICVEFVLTPTGASFDNI